jgi:hypothetical protein
VGPKVLLTNWPSKRKPGPEEVHAGNLCSFAHQAYWGFRFLAEKRGILWQKVLAATTVAQVTRVGRACWRPGVLAQAGYGAAGQMERLREKGVAIQVVAAKKHRRYPKSNRPSSQDRKMIFLAIAVSAGVWEIEFSTALRKLAQAGLGIRYMTKEVHRMDRLEQIIRAQAIVWAEPIGNYFWFTSDGKWTALRDLPCEVPNDWRGGFIINGVGPSGSQSTFSRTLPLGLAEFASPPEPTPTEAKKADLPTRIPLAPNHVMCRCGAIICARNRKLALKALEEHERQVHAAKQWSKRFKQSRRPPMR